MALRSDNYIDNMPRGVREMLAMFAAEADARHHQKKERKQLTDALRKEQRAQDRIKELNSLGEQGKIQKMTAKLKKRALAAGPSKERKNAVKRKLKQHVIQEGYVGK